MSDFDTIQSLLGPTKHIAPHATAPNVYVHARGAVTLLDSFSGYFVVYDVGGRAVERGHGSAALAEALERRGMR